MITREEMTKIILNDPEYDTVQTILSKHKLEVDFTVYTMSKNVLLTFIKLDNANDIKGIKDLVALITEANTREKDLEELIFEKTMKAQQVDGLGQLLNAFEDDNNPDRLFVLIGETGVGKTHLLTQRYKDQDIPFYSANEGVGAYELMFSLEPSDNGELTPKPTPFMLAVIGDGNGSGGKKVRVDEVNLYPHETLMLIQGLTDRKDTIVIGSKQYKIAKGFKILATMNPPSETDERKPLGDALLGRAVSYVLELTDDILIQRLKVSAEWLSLVRQLFNHIRASGFVDVRDLNYRDYDKMTRYDFENIIKAKVCQGDVQNIRTYNTVRNTGEYDKLVAKIRKENINNAKKS
jgi:hypothetical protein